MILIAIVILFIIYLIVKTYLNKTHSYWDKQPVSTTYKKSGLITDRKQPPIKNNNYILKEYTEIELPHIITHLNKHFIREYSYSNEYIKWYFAHSQNMTLCLLKRNLSLIGTISSIHITLSLDNKKLGLGYVDFLAINKDYRNKRLAPLLISNLIDKSNEKIFIFKIEQTPLPFNHILKFRYYGYLIPPNLKYLNNFNEINRTNITRVFQFYKTNSIKFILKQTYSFDEFNYWFIPRQGVINSLILQRNNNIICFISYIISKFKIDDQSENLTAEIICILSDDIINHIQYLINYLSNLGFRYIVITNTANNQAIISNFNFFPGKITYLHMYNYNYHRILKPNEVLLNIP